MIELIVKGIPYKDYILARGTVSIESMANDFEFTASAVNGFPPFKSGDSVVIIIDGIKRITGSIEEVNGVDEEGSHTVTYSGRDKTGDFIDSDINGLDDLRSPISLGGIIRELITNIGSDIKVINHIIPATFNPAEDLIDIHDGDKAMNIALAYARKRQVLLSSTADGDILITQSTPTDSGVTLQSIKGGLNNIIGQSWSVRSSQRFRTYIHRGQLDPRTLNFAGATSNDSLENQGAKITDAQVIDGVEVGPRQGRQMVVVEKNAYSNEQLKQRAKWSRQLAKARSTRYNCSVKGHVDQNNNQWTENTLVQINSDSANITRKMLLNTITFVQGEGIPTTTDLGFVERDVYTVDDAINAQKPLGDQNNAFTSF